MYGNTKDPEYPKQYWKEKTEFIKYAKPLNSEKIDYNKYLELSKDKSLLLRPRWYPAKELWDPFVKEMSTYSFAFEC